MSKDKIRMHQAYCALEDLERLLDDRIAENNRIKNVCSNIFTEQANHAFMLYRDKVWTAKYILRDMGADEICD